MKQHSNTAATDWTYREAATPTPGCSVAQGASNEPVPADHAAVLLSLATERTVAMSDEIKIVTNNAPRDVIDAWELTADERKEFDYLNWDAIERGEDSASFFRYRGSLYDLGEFMVNTGLPEFSPLRNWDGHIADSFFSGILVRYVDAGERVIVARFYS